MSNTILALAVSVTISSLSYAEGTLTLRSNPVIQTSDCAPGDDSMVIIYQTGVYGLDAAKTRAYVTFNGVSVGSAEFFLERGASFPQGLVSCDRIQGHGDVGIYFSDTNGNKDDNFGKGYHFNK